MSAILFVCFLQTMLELFPFSIYSTKRQFILQVILSAWYMNLQTSSCRIDCLSLSRMSRFLPLRVLPSIWINSIVECFVLVVVYHDIYRSTSTTVVWVALLAKSSSPYYSKLFSDGLFDMIIDPICRMHSSLHSLGKIYRAGTVWGMLR